ncbi:MAG: hypothetical protein M1838_005083, partial [Thelocarpon superellum]
KNATFQDIDHLITRYRDACEKTIFSDFDFATSKHVEARLWDAHGKINNKFRKNLGRFREEHGNKKPVELRKMIKHYLDFIKASQRFYRAYVQRLSTQFGGVPELELVAQKFKVGGAADLQSRPLPRNQRQILLSCHQTLVRLGDLSRYRESDLNTKEPNWGPAIGYYDLAGVIYPASGASHNQLAVIALADGNHFRATYHLYRALAADEPHPTARGNLEIELKKILAAWDKGELITTGSGEKSDAARALLAWFVRLHARCYRGQDFAEHEELENEVLGQLVVDLKERSLDTTLPKVILTNVAAEFFAGVRVEADPECRDNVQAYFFFLRLNVKTFFALLQVLNGEVQTGEMADKISSVTRRILPGLRHCSTWLVANSALLAAQVGDNSLNVQIKEMWRMYASSLTLLAATFAAETLPAAEYLLEEDEDTLGFKPFDTNATKSRYYVGDKKKPRSYDVRVKRHHPNVEMLVRVRDFLTDGVELAVRVLYRQPTDMGSKPNRNQKQTQIQTQTPTRQNQRR